MIEVFAKDTSYLYRKISDRERDGRIDIEKTIENMQSRIIQKRREDGNRNLLRDELTADEARELWDALDSVKNEHNEVSNDAFASIFYHDLPSDERRKVFSDEFWYEDLLVTSPDRRAKAFCDVVAPVFAEILKAEMNEVATVTV